MINKLYVANIRKTQSKSNLRKQNNFKYNVFPSCYLKKNSLPGMAKVPSKSLKPPYYGRREKKQFLLVIYSFYKGNEQRIATLSN